MTRKRSKKLRSNDLASQRRAMVRAQRLIDELKNGSADDALRVATALIVEFREKARRAQ